MKYVKGRAHGPEYNWHKYWSRKPANVISAYLAELVPKKGFVVDPFSGSGVVTREATKLGFSAAAFDVNPIAVEISKFMISRLNRDSFVTKATQILEQVESELGDLYRYSEKEIRFLVHHVATACPKCGIENVYEKSIHGSNNKKCVNCQGKLSFGLTSMVKTYISEIHYSDGSDSNESAALEKQSQISNSKKYLGTTSFDMVFVDNKRTLTSREISTSEFFTPRNFLILSRVAELAHQVPNEEVKMALLLLVTGTSAQASRLIASRGKLSGGGQAWTIPGFWVPPIHLESNPFTHLKARLKKMNSALEEIQREQNYHGIGTVTKKSAQAGLKSLIDEGRHADLVFMDPPYGDSVSFLEFSAIWNAFLKRDFDYSEDISVSDRIQEPMNMAMYKGMLETICQLVSSALKPDGKVLLTFNNNSLEAWKAILGALQKANFKAVEATYQDPAVISSKSQKSLNGSYIGDFYVVFEKARNATVPFSSVRNDFEKFLKRMASARGGSLSHRLAYRLALNEWLLMNIDAEDISQLELLFSDLFEKLNGEIRLLGTPLDVPQVTDVILEIANQVGIDDEYEKFASRVRIDLRSFGVPSIDEAIAIYEFHKTSSDQLW
jgi:16S rRNA G966 N2-methylase RsmD/predicted nucleic-acid-binding Zn-ribbon protein